MKSTISLADSHIGNTQLLSTTVIVQEAEQRKRVLKCTQYKESEQVCEKVLKSQQQLRCQEDVTIWRRRTSPGRERASYLRPASDEAGA
ncbi:hypothetical protein RRG08_015443 [Elysia crispata]|uniref:Uncharacterized protein n=1 Tax=Elysia crispata TaxID=231223 RepID=A0AAE0YHN2_9GAST|nr:hypothetical protein RRG08_015443 [Elysia crispata]